MGALARIHEGRTEMKEIKEKIVGFEIVTQDSSAKQQNNVVEMHEKLERPKALEGKTYKLKTPLSEHALYVTINDVVLNEGTEHEQKRPFEIFINSKNMEHFQWIVGLTLILSAVFRKGGDATFLVEELGSVFDPKGGYIRPGRGYIPSLVAEIGSVIEEHMESLGLIQKEPMTEEMRRMLESKRAEAEKDASGGIAGAKICKVCQEKTVVMKDGCETCLGCGESRCG